MRKMTCMHPGPISESIHPARVVRLLEVFGQLTLFYGWDGMAYQNDKVRPRQYCHLLDESLQTECRDSVWWDIHGQPIGCPANSWGYDIWFQRAPDWEISSGADTLLAMRGWEKDDINDSASHLENRGRRDLYVQIFRIGAMDFAAADRSTPENRSKKSMLWLGSPSWPRKKQIWGKAAACLPGECSINVCFVNCQ